MGEASARPKVWLFFVPITKGDYRGSLAFSTPPAAKYAAKLSQSFDSLARGDKCRNSQPSPWERVAEGRVRVRVN